MKKDEFCASFIREMKDMANFKGFYKPRDVYQETIDVCIKFNECMRKIEHELDEIRKIFKREAER